VCERGACQRERREREREGETGDAGAMANDEPAEGSPSTPPDPTGMPVATSSAEIMRSDQHHDVFALCIACLAPWCVRAGVVRQAGTSPEPPLFSLEDFKTAWRGINFSHIYAAKPKSYSAEGYMQLLYDGCFQVAVVNMTASHVEQVVTALRGAGVLDGVEDPANGRVIDVAEVAEVFNGWQEVKDRLALFALWALHGAQPSHSQNHEMVLIRVEERYFDIVERWAEYVECASGGPEREDLRDFVQVFAGLWRQDAFCFGANLGFTPFTTSHNVVQKETEKERALVKDLRFHLSSTLPGMGVGKMAALCAEYWSKLRDVLVHAEDYVDDSEISLGIADLDFGSELVRLVDVQKEKIHFTLFGDGAEGRFFAGLGKMTSSKRPSQSAQVSFNKVMQREKARKIDIRQKKKRMEEAIGLDLALDEGTVAMMPMMAMTEMTEMMAMMAMMAMMVLGGWRRTCRD
jgi:hypothetical protein